MRSTTAASPVAPGRPTAEPTMSEPHYAVALGRPTRLNAFRNRLYYLLKPAIPKAIRIRIRSWFTIRKWAAVRDIWPITPGAGRQPEGWTGWPNGKKFALVLTHDVEGQEGLDNCRKLMQLETEMGFRASFNFIPEGTYRTPVELRRELTANGFEVGVHDLRHDGLLYDSPRQFALNAMRINQHLSDWGAVGFRSGFMLNRLDWLHALNIQYDASTFDADPFEPQPEGRQTIFPFWVSASETRPSKSGPNPRTDSDPRGYVELPYTLPQDSTLFLLLREKTPEIWMRKLDWIVEHGGMALINIHPDYIEFGDKGCERDRYPVAFIRQFLAFVSKKYSGDYWNPLAKDIAKWFAETRQQRPVVPSRCPDGESESALPGVLKGKRAAVLLYSRYPADPRPRRAAEAMIEAGMQVDLLCLAGDKSDTLVEDVGGVHVVRVRLKHRRDSKLMYFWQYGRFFVSSFFYLLTRGLRQRYDVVHIHNMPDFLVFAALIPKLRGARIILDLHDPMPELMESIYGLKTDDWKVRVLRRIERWSIRFSNLALTPNITFKNLFVSRSCQSDKMHIVMNSPQQQIFDPARFAPETGRLNASGEFHVMHHGSIVHRHGVDLLVEAVAHLRPKIPGICLDIYGAPTPFLDTVLALAERLGIGDIVRYHGAKTQDEIAEAILNCNVGIVPNRRSSFIEINFPTRLFEYLAMHRPVIGPRTKGICDYFGPEQLLMFEPNSVADLAAKILWVRDNPEQANAVVENGLQVYRENLWSREKARFLGKVATLFN